MCCFFEQNNETAKNCINGFPNQNEKKFKVLAIPCIYGGFCENGKYLWYIWVIVAIIILGFLLLISCCCCCCCGKCCCGNPCSCCFDDKKVLNEDDSDQPNSPIPLEHQPNSPIPLEYQPNSPIPEYSQPNSPLPEYYSPTSPQTSSGVGLNTAANVSYLTQLEKAFIFELNKLRTNPRGTANAMKEFRKYYNGKIFSEPGQINLSTTEGVSALNECIAVLENQSPMGVLKPDEGLSKAAQYHVRDQGPTGKTGHDGSNGSTMTSRINSHCSDKWNLIGENISYGNDDGRRILWSLIIDDNVPSRGHRTNCLNPEFTYIGVSCGPHSYYHHMCVMDFARFSTK